MSRKRPDLNERNFKHGLKTREYKNRFYILWSTMKNRCYNLKSKDYPSYGGRGINVCEEWINNPENFVEWCKEQGDIPKGYLLDREDNNGPYSPDNCRFVDINLSNRNKRNNIWIDHNGETLCFKDFVKKYGVVSYAIAKKRVREGMNYTDAALVPDKRFVFIEHEGNNLSFSDFVRKFGVVNYDTAIKRVEKGMEYKEAALTPYKRKRR